MAYHFKERGIIAAAYREFARETVRPNGVALLPAWRAHLKDEYNASLSPREIVFESDADAIKFKFRYGDEGKSV